MLRCVYTAIITQQPTRDWPERSKVLAFDFLTSYECSDSWEELTNKGRLTIPKNLYYKNAYGKLEPVFGLGVNIGGFSPSVPLVLRGDKITIEAGYITKNDAGNDERITGSVFTGYVSKVGSKIPIELELQDNMYKLKQTPVASRTFSKTETLEDIVRYILTGTGFTLRTLTTTTFGTFTVGNETAAQVLERIRKTYGVESYFRGDELRCGVLIYIPGEAITEKFRFQQTIIDDELEYKRRDDVILSAVAYNTITKNKGTTKDGATKTALERLEVLVTIVGGIRQPDVVIQRGDTAPENEEGERRTLFYPGAKTAKELGDLAYAELIKYYYTGLRGAFTTFGLPYVRQGDNADIKDPKLPERDGIYRIKKVIYSGGADEGVRQKIFLDFKLPI